MLQEVDSKFTGSRLVSITPRHSGNITVPSSGSKRAFKCSIKSFTNFVSLYTPSAGLQPNTKVKFAGLHPVTFALSLRVCADDVRADALTYSLLPYLDSRQHAKRTKK
jgi:hypothetical protein